ncbi:MAG: UDP-N-acetylglucosamine 2-epimerase, partial [Bacteroidota bacterium]|nr:UDP-N-acetylglucosamine 2-epimerase [Bacteroidota bacterium]
NLIHEGLGEVTSFPGDIMVDTMNNNLRIALQKSSVLTDLKLQDNGFSLLTLHRDYNVDNPAILNNLLNQLGQLGVDIIFPVHPRTRKMLGSLPGIPGNIVVTEPVGYLDFITLENASTRIITDSGGIQKEAYILKKPCITLRTETEWVETVEEKWNLLISPTDMEIASKINAFVTPEKQNPVFGENVTDKMIAIINTIN